MIVLIHINEESGNKIALLVNLRLFYRSYSRIAWISCLFILFKVHLC